MNLPHDYTTCNCPGCRAIKIDLKYHGRTSRPIPTGHWPPRPPKQETAPLPAAEGTEETTPAAPTKPAQSKKK